MRFNIVSDKSNDISIIQQFIAEIALKMQAAQPGIDPGWAFIIRYCLAFVVLMEAISIRRMEPQSF